MADHDPDQPSAASRFEEEDRLRPEPDDPRRRPDVPRPGNKYAWVVAILALMGISVVLLTTSLPNQGAAIRGPRPGERIPSFAVPLTTANVPNDTPANVFQNRHDARSAGRNQSACQVRSKIVLNSCELRRGPFVLTTLVTKGADCEPQVDRVERVRRDYPDVQFAAVISGNKIDEAKQIATNRGWTIPVGVDVDGRIQNLLGAGVCPTTVFSNARGRVVKTELGNLTEAQLRADIGRIDPRR